MDDDRVNDWLRGRNFWTILLVLWALALACGLLGQTTSQMLFEHDPAPTLTSNLPWLLGGSLFVALGSTVGLRRRQV